MTGQPEQYDSQLPPQKIDLGHFNGCLSDWLQLSRTLRVISKESIFGIDTILDLKHLAEVEIAYEFLNRTISSKLISDREYTTVIGCIIDLYRFSLAETDKNGREKPVDFNEAAGWAVRYFLLTGGHRLESNEEREKMKSAMKGEFKSNPSPKKKYLRKEIITNETIT